MRLRRFFWFDCFSKILNTKLEFLQIFLSARVQFPGYHLTGTPPSVYVHPKVFIEGGNSEARKNYLHPNRHLFSYSNRPHSVGAMLGMGTVHSVQFRSMKRLNWLNSNRSKPLKPVQTEPLPSWNRTETERTMLKPLFLEPTHP